MRNKAGAMIALGALSMSLVSYELALAQQNKNSDAKQNGRVALGVQTMPSPGLGVLIAYVAPNSPAAKAGLQVGDFIRA